MDYDQSDVLDQGVVWARRRVGRRHRLAPVRRSPAGGLHGRGENNEQFINHAIVEAVLAVWIDDVPDGCLKDEVLTGLADAIMVWLNDGGNVYLHCRHDVSRICRRPSA